MRGEVGRRSGLGGGRAGLPPPPPTNSNSELSRDPAPFPSRAAGVTIDILAAAAEIVNEDQFVLDKHFLQPNMVS